ncbi:MAG TPA: ABC transporter substrate-binding protein [Sporichthyaceae bacterium]|jgi:ABC-type branched-subunit amino acid transport system substrate-binding protein
MTPIRRTARAVPVVAAVGLLVAACGGGGPTQQVAMATPQQPAPQQQTAQDATTSKLVEAVAQYLASQSAPKKDAALDSLNKKALQNVIDQAKAELSKTKDSTKAVATTAPLDHGVQAVQADKAQVSDNQKNADTERYKATNGATDTGVSKTDIKLGSINMHGMALANVVTEPVVRGTFATAAAINDRGGVLGRKLDVIDCDDGPGEVSRAKSCIKKLVGQDHIFSMISSIDWASASLHDDLHQYHLPYVGSWAYSQTEWQDPYMFPTHMSMIHEAMAGAHWVANVVHPKTYGLLCLTSPEMQLACGQVQKIVDASGAKMVKKVDIAISETSLAPQVLAFRAANPDHIIHYTINSATLVKFMVESAQQGYYPPKGVSGNHMAAEALGSFIGNWPAGRYWTNTTYKLWGAQFYATMQRYSRSNVGFTHHIVQAAYVGVNMFAEAAREVGPNLTRDRLMAALSNGNTFKTDSGMDQKFSYTPAERGGSYENQTWNHDEGQGREFMYKYDNANTVAHPDGSPNGWVPDPDQFVIHTDH